MSSKIVGLLVGAQDGNILELKIKSGINKNLGINLVFLVHIFFQNFQEFPCSFKIQEFVLQSWGRLYFCCVFFSCSIQFHYLLQQNICLNFLNLLQEAVNYNFRLLHWKLTEPICGSYSPKNSSIVVLEPLTPTTIKTIYIYNYLGHDKMQIG